jgi:hypothetical protein
MTTIDPAAIISLQNRAGKGHAPRKTADYEAYANNYDLIFGKNKKQEPEQETVVESEPENVSQTPP